jgi:hypothetical protein
VSHVSDYTGLSAEDVARAKASDANLTGIIAGRRRAAAALLTSTREPERQVRQDFAPLRPQGQADVAWTPPPTPPAIPGGGEAQFSGEGPPTPENTVGSQPGDWYLDTLTGTLYELT